MASLKRSLKTYKWFGLLVILGAGATLGVISRKGQTPDPIQPNDLLSAADPKHGALIADSCLVCHDLREKSAEKKVGPSLLGIVGALTANQSQYQYSPALLALKKRGHIWTTDGLYEWLRDPSTYAPGTTMNYEGMLDPQDRMDLIAFLITLK